MARAPRNSEADQRALAVVQPPRLPMPPEAGAAGMSPGQWKALVDAVFPSAKSVDGVMLAIEYCKARRLDVFKRAVHVVPMWNSAAGREVETVWPGINELRTTASRTGQWAGNDECLFGPTLKTGFKASEQREKWDEATRSRKPYKMEAECPAFDYPEWAQVTVYKIVGGQRVPFVGPKVRFVEMFSGEKGLRVPNSKWRASPFQMLEKCAEAAALRRAFPEELANDYTAEEMEGKAIDLQHAPKDHTGPVETIEGEPVEDKKPQRATAKSEPWKDLGFSEREWREIERLQRKIDQTSEVNLLMDAREYETERLKDEGMSKPALDELRMRFNVAIEKIEGPGASGEGESAGAASDDNEPADEDGNEQ